MPLAVLAFFTSITVLLFAIFSPALGERARALDADVAAVNVLAYKAALTGFLDANQSFTGVIPNGSITLPTGMKRDLNWTNLVADQTLYVYEVTPSKKSGLVSSLYVKTERSLLVGTRQGNTYVSAQGTTSGALGSAANVIPDGSIVVIGK